MLLSRTAQCCERQWEEKMGLFSYGSWTVGATASKDITSSEERSDYNLCAVLLDETAHLRFPSQALHQLGRTSYDHGVSRGPRSISGYD